MGYQYLPHSCSIALLALAGSLLPTDNTSVQSVVGKAAELPSAAQSSKEKFCSGGAIFLTNLTEFEHQATFLIR
jgi:hypothetical protein